MSVMELALLVYDILNELIADDDRSIDNLTFYRDKLKASIDEGLSHEGIL